VGVDEDTDDETNLKQDRVNGTTKTKTTTSCQQQPNRRKRILTEFDVVAGAVKQMRTRQTSHER